MSSADESDEEYAYGVYPIQTNEKQTARRTGRAPYNKVTSRWSPTVEPVVEIPPRQSTLQKHAPSVEDWEQRFDEAQQGLDEEMKEIAKKKRPKKIREFNYNMWDDFKQRQANITNEELLQIAPVTKKQIRDGISFVKPKITFAEVNELQEEESEEEPKSSAYFQCSIGQYPVNAIADTGAGSSIITKHILDRMGWEIDQPARSTIVIADGKKSTPLGEVIDVPVTVGQEIIPIRMLVMSAKTYDIILGNNWLTKAGAVMYMNTERLTITWRGRKTRVPISIRKGILPGIVDDEEIDEAEPELY